MYPRDEKFDYIEINSIILSIRLTLDTWLNFGYIFYDLLHIKYQG